jgi:membrane protein DedA with SNARE-associated domain
MFDWITQLIGRAGYAGIALLMFLENVFPPIPSWLVMPLAGFEASSGRF